MDVVEAVVRAGGARRKAGLGRWAVTRAVADGDLVVVRSRVVALPGCEPARMAAAVVGGVPSCATAARLQGLELLRPVADVHVTVPRNRAVLPAGGWRVHRRDAPVLDGVTRLDRTAADCARCLPDLDAIVVLDAALRRGVPTADIAQHLVGPGSAAARRLLNLADARSGSVGESVARVRFHHDQVPAVPQVHIPGVGWVDFLVDGWLVIEIDGLAYHGDGRQFAEDRRRDAALVEQGFTVVRFTHNDVLWRPDHVVAVVRRVLARGRHEAAATDSYTNRPE